MLPTYPRRRTFWLSASPARAVVETVVLAAVLSLLALLTSHPFSAAGILRLNSSLIFLDGPFCALLCAARLRRGEGSWRRRALINGSIGVVLGLIPTAIVIISLVVAATMLGTHDVNQLNIRGFTIHMFAVLAFVGFCVEFTVFRAGILLLRYWNRLRRTHLLWSLTHAHLMVVVIGATLLSVPVLGTVLFTSRPPLLVVPLLFLLAAFTAVALLIVLPPSALFSYLFARRTTRRLEALTEATSRLRSGDYGVRVLVTGEDEVGQLQSDFNAMATELERAMHDLQAERDRVAGLLTARRELIASVSHELRTPVATLRSYLESTNMHWDGAPPPTLYHDLQVMERETVRLQALINDLFTLARVEVGRLELRCEPTDVAALALRLADTMAPLAWQSNRVEVVAEGSASLPLAYVDASRLEQVLQNLLHNGVRHTPPGGIVALATHAEANAIVLQVKDTGEGIASDDLPRVWERFYRTAAARERPESGTGLGLALVKELTEAMGGTVSVESTLGQGSCFTLRLPRASEGIVSAPTLADTRDEQRAVVAAE